MILKPRNRLVNFRLTEEEFQALQTATATQNARSVSDFARGAVLRQVEGGATHPASLLNLETAISQLEARIRQLSHTV
jgi:uncharacterized protein (DUF1778 family)